MCAVTANIKLDGTKARRSQRPALGHGVGGLRSSLRSSSSFARFDFRKTVKAQLKRKSAARQYPTVQIRDWSLNPK
jgi:hypothetical protein